MKCTVIGGVNMDIGGVPNAPLLSSDSNPGRIVRSPGGVGRNIAHNMTLLGLKVSLLTALGTDSDGACIQKQLEELSIDLSATLHTDKANTSTYLYIADHTGDMALAVSDMQIYNQLTPEYIYPFKDYINDSFLVMIDTNITEESLMAISEFCTVPIYADPVSCKKTAKLKSILPKIHTLAPNRLEAEVLSGHKINSEEDLKEAATILLDKGVSQIFITLGSDGLFAASRSEFIHLPILPGKLINATGAGDALMAGLALAKSRNLNLRESSLLGLSCAAIAIEGTETINPRMNAGDAFQRACIPFS